MWKTIARRLRREPKKPEPSGPGYSSSTADDSAYWMVMHAASAASQAGDDMPARAECDASASSWSDSGSCDSGSSSGGSYE